MREVEVPESGAVVDAEVGDELLVRVPENASTGYQWNVASVAGPLDVVSSELVPLGVEEERPGMGSERFIRFAVKGKSDGDGIAVRLELKREWETEPIERFEFRARTK